MKQPHGRVSDPLGIPDLQRFAQAYEQDFRELNDYSVHFEHLVAEYSRGADARQLREALNTVLDKLALYQRKLESESRQPARVFAHHGSYAEVFRKAFVLLAIGLCLRVPEEQIVFLANNVERGDPLLETLIARAAPGREHTHSSPAFKQQYDALYECLSSSGPQREQLLRDYLGIWYSDKMQGFAFKDMHLEPDPLHYVGYWCFEVAGVVAALGVDDRMFVDHPHYPRDLVRMFRSGSEA